MFVGPDTVKLEDIVDLEAQIALDRAQDPDALRERDRAIYHALPTSDSRADVLSRWLEALRVAGDNPALGRRIALGFRWVRGLLLLTGLLLGWGTAMALLAYSEGGPPVNVGTFLLVVVGAQLALLVLSLVGITFTRLFPNAPVFGDIQQLWRTLATWLGGIAGAAESRLTADVREALLLGRSRLRRRGSLYRPLERWTLVELSQTFGVAFNAGVLAGGLLLVVVSDLAFGWGTTTESLNAESMHRLVRVVSMPWAELLPDAVPSRELIEESRYSRLEGRYSGAAPGTRGDPTLVGGWWPFLLAATVVYGFLPRLLLLTVSITLRARALARVPLDAPEVEQILRRLTAPKVATQGEHEHEHERGRDTNAPAARGEGEHRAPPLAPSGTCVVVRWRNADAPDAAIRRVLKERFDWQVERVLDLDFGRPGRATAELVGEGAVVVLAESWEPPDKGLRRWLESLRGTVGEQKPIWVLLFSGRSGEQLNPAERDELAIWRDRLELIEDPFLGVESVEAA